MPSITNGSDSISTLIESVMKSCTASPSPNFPRRSHPDREQHRNNNQRKSARRTLKTEAAPRSALCDVAGASTKRSVINGSLKPARH